MSYANPNFIGDETAVDKAATLELGEKNGGTGNIANKNQNEQNDIAYSNIPQRENWGKGVEFLMSCIAMSVGLGNVWRFPFTALENGGGAFLIPYLIVLLVVGRPLYYLEMILGQFSSRGSVKAFDLSPAMRGTGVGQLIAVFCICTYYASIMALVGSYLFDSFKTPLPWSMCKPEWRNCIDAAGNVTKNAQYLTSLKNSTETRLTSSSEIYFVKDVLREYDNIDNGIGTPSLNLALCLLAAWLVIIAVLIKGVHSSGKASYFLALFPYVIMIVLLIRALTLPGSMNGIMYFIRPQWDKIFLPQVWYAAITQCFFSLAVCFGNIIMYSSYNKFNHNVYRDANIVTTLDTLTSLLAGVTIFGILGHLAHVIGTDDISSVIKGGANVAFISYPDAIARFDLWPQFFSVMFFFMLFVLGIGSNIAMCSCIVTAIRDQFPSVKPWQAVLMVAVVGFSIGLCYVTPGGQFLLVLVDFYGASFIAYILAIAEIIAVCWIYGVNRLCRDVEFMIGHRPGVYWRLCWGFLTPILMIVILIYFFFTYQPLDYNKIPYPLSAMTVGWCITAVGVLQLPLWATHAIVRQKGNTLYEKTVGAFKPKENWGPKDPATLERYKKYVANFENSQVFADKNLGGRIKRHIFG